MRLPCFACFFILLFQILFLMKPWSVLLLLVALAACSKPQKIPYLTLNPDLPVTGQAELYFLEKDYSLFDIATADKDNTRLYFRKDSVPEGIYELRINNKAVTPLIISNGLPFSISGNFNANPTQLTITNNEETIALRQAQLMTQALSEEIKNVAANMPD